MNKIILNIGGMSCSACSNGLEKYLNKQNGIKSANVNLILAQALIEYDDQVSVSDLERYIKEAGFESLGIYNNQLTEKKVNKKSLLAFSMLALMLLYISMGHMTSFPTINLLNMEKNPINYSVTLFILTVPFLIYGKEIFINGYKNLIHKTPNMDTLVSIGTLSSFLYSFYNMIMVILKNNIYVEKLYFESVAFIILFIKLGRYVDTRSKEKTKEAIKELIQITPKKALVKQNNSEKEVTLDEIKKGDILISKPGMKIAVDGTITKGNAHLDEAFITGESIPTKKRINDKVLAGSINQDGYIEYKAEKIGKNSTISEIVKLIVEATNTKAPIARLADIASSYFVPTIIIISISTLIGYILLGFELNQSIETFVTILVVACPCALGLATPLAIIISEGLCAKDGILVKNSETLENAHKVDTIVFDKTGTLTYGNLKISQIYNYSKYNNDDLIKLVASIESNSKHPISKAFKDYTKANNCKVEGFKSIPGIGLKGFINENEIHIGNNKLFNILKIENNYTTIEEELSNLGNSIIYIVENNKIIGLIGVKDIIRNNSKQTIDKLKKLNKEVIMLTGDNQKTANIIANNIGIQKVIANALPSDKAKIIKNLINNNKNVMMIGDGINDAPALTTANIGISINSGTDIAADSAYVILTNNNLEKIPTLIKISKKTVTNIKQNLFWAFFYNACMIPLAIGFLKPFGLSMNPITAGFFMTVSSLTVVFNALRLKKVNK